MATGGIVVIKLGSKSESFRIHKALLVHHSEYFRNALTGRWKESEEQAVTLEDVEPDTLSLFVHWLYAQKLPEDEAGWKQMLTLDKYPEAQSWQEICMHLCVTAYAFGDRFLTPAFRRVANNVFAAILRRNVFMGRMNRKSIKYAFTNIRSDRVILQQLVDDFCNTWGQDVTFYHGEEAMEDLPPAVLGRMPQCFIERGQREGSGEYPDKCYLEHESDKETEDCGRLHMRCDEEDGLAHFE